MKFEENKIISCAYKIEIGGKSYRLSAKIANKDFGEQEAQIELTPLLFTGRNCFTSPFDGSRLLDSIAFDKINEELQEETPQLTITNKTLVAMEATLKDFKTNKRADFSIQLTDGKYHATLTYEGTSYSKQYPTSMELDEIIDNLVAVI